MSLLLNPLQSRALRTYKDYKDVLPTLYTCVRTSIHIHDVKRTILAHMGYRERPYTSLMSLFSISTPVISLCCEAMHFMHVLINVLIFNSTSLFKSIKMAPHHLKFHLDPDRIHLPISCPCYPQARSIDNQLPDFQTDFEPRQSVF